MQVIHAEAAVSLAELKQDPVSVLEQSEGEPVAILSGDHAAAYLLSAERYEKLLEALDDLTLAELVRQRQGQDRIKIDVHDLSA
jgi:antitoxin StbD